MTEVTESPRGRSLRSGVWRAIALGAVLVLGCEFAARAVEPYAGVPFGVGVIAKQSRLDRFVADRQCRDVVFYGSSQVAWGLRPDVVERETGLTAYNAGLLAAGPVAIRPWLMERVVPALDPATVVISVEETLFYPGAVASSDPVLLELETLNTSLKRASFWSVPQRAAEWFRSHSALIRLRPQLQHADTAWRIVVRSRARSRGLATEQLFGDDGWVDAERLTLDDIKVEGRPGVGFPRGGARASNAPGFAALEQAVTALRAQGRRVVLVAMPLNSTARTPIFRSYLPMIREVARSLDVPFVNLFALSGRDELFFNEDHLNARGAEAATTELVAQLDSAGLTNNRSC